MEKNLVLGANGHLGSNVVKVLKSQKKHVRASTFSSRGVNILKELGCEIAKANIMDQVSLKNVMEGMDNVYICAAIYKVWAKDPKKEIIDINIESTKNIFKVASENNVKKIIYIGSTLTLKNDKEIMDENSGWNYEDQNPYTKSKIEAEKIAWELSKKYKIDMVAILPSAMIGSNIDNHLTPSMEFLNSVTQSKIPFDPQFYFNFIDVSEAAKAIVNASSKKNKRYIIAQEKPTTSTEIFKWANEVDANVKIPNKASKKKLLFLAAIMGFISKINKKKPLLQKDMIEQFTNANYKFDISKSKIELGFKPSSPKVVLQNVFRYLKEINNK